MPPLIVATEYVEVSSVPLATPAWRVVNVSELWQGPEVRGDDRLVPLVDGVVPYPRRPDVTVRTLRVHIFGDYDHEGNAHTDGRAGLWANIAYLRDNVADPVTSGDGTRPIVVHLPDGDTLEGDAHVGPLEWSVQSPVWALATLDVSLPVPLTIVAAP